MSQPWKKPDAGGAATTPATLPAWMKNKAPDAKPAATQQAPPPFKPPVAGFKPPAANIPPVAGTPPVAATGGQANWMKGKQTTQPGTQAPPFKPPTTQAPPPFKPPVNPATQAGGVPAWMKNKGGSSSNASLQKSEQQSQKVPEEQRSREEQNSQLEPQNKSISVEEPSIIEQGVQPTKIKKNDKQKAKQAKPSPVKKAPTPKVKKMPAGNTHFHKFLESLNLACSRNEEYEDKLEHQRTMLKAMCEFVQNARTKLSEYMGHRKVTPRKKNCINLENLFIEYGLVEGVTVERTSGDSKISETTYKTKMIEDLQTSFCLYQIIFSLIIKLMKKTTTFRIRAPLLCWISYKGIEFMCEGICEQLTDAPTSITDNYPEISGELSQLEKQLQDAGYGFISRKNFVIKRVTIGQEDTFILYLAENIHSMISGEDMRYNPYKFAPFLPITQEKLTNFDMIFSENVPITYNEAKKLKQIIKSSTAKMRQYLNMFLVAHAIRVVYASCQGQVDQSSFWQLVFSANTQIWGMIEQCYKDLNDPNCAEIPSECQPFLANVLELMVPFKFTTKKIKVESEQNKNTVEKAYKRKPQMLEHRMKIHLYPFDKLELFEIIDLFSKNLEINSKITLAEESLTVQEEIAKISNNLIVNQLEIFKNKIDLLLKKWQAGKVLKGNKQKSASSAYFEALKMLEDYSFKKNNDKEKFVLMPLLLTVYMINDHSTAPADKQQDKKEQSRRPQQNSQNSVSKTEEIQEKKSPKTDKEDKTEQPNETKMLKCLSKLLSSFNESTGTEQQNWFHGNLYLLVSEYYSRKKALPSPLYLKSQLSEQQKLAKSQAHSGIAGSSLNASEIQKSAKSGYFSQSMPESQRESYAALLNSIPHQIHPHYEQCMKFLQHAHSIFLQYYGAFSFELADMIAQKSVVLFNIEEYQKASAAAEQALKIYKSSSKHSSNISLSKCLVGKCLIEMGKKNKNMSSIEEGRQIIQKVCSQLVTLGVHYQAILAYEYLFNSYAPQSRFIQKHQQLPNNQTLSEAYLQKMAVIALNCRHSLTLKNVIHKILHGQAAIYSKQKVLTLRQLASESQDEEGKHQIDQIFLQLEQESKAFGGFVQMTKWSLRVLEFKADSYEWERAAQIMRNLLTFFERAELSLIF